MPAACGHAWAELSRYIVHMEIEGVSSPVLSLEGLYARVAPGLLNSTSDVDTALREIRALA